MPSASIPKRPVGNTLVMLALWVVFYGSFTLFRPALFDDADSVHAEVAREMLLRHDWVTLYANGIRYLEKAPLLYWLMAASFKVLGVSAAAARVPLALTVLALTFAIEAFARRTFRSARAGLYSALILLSCFGVFIFTRINLPDAMVCLWLTLAMLCFWTTEEQSHPPGAVIPPPRAVVPPSSAVVPPPNAVILSAAKDPCISPDSLQPRRPLCYAFATCCALNVLTKGLIGIVFPVVIVLTYLMLTRGPRGAIRRIRQLHPLSSAAVFFAIAAPWHILIALANPTQGHPGGVALAHGHWSVPLPTDGNVHGWLWFYFVNEQLLRYLNLRVPRDYDTVPLWLFWCLCLVWLMPWSAYLFHAISGALPLRSKAWRNAFHHRALTADQKTQLLLMLWAAFPMLFFSLSTRQEYYVLPSLPPLIVLIAARLCGDSGSEDGVRLHRTNLRITALLVGFGAIFAALSIFLLLHTRLPSASIGLAALLQQNPGNYALSMGHFLDLNVQALGLFRLPLAIAAASLFFGPLTSYILRKRAQPHAATLALAAGAFGFVLAAHLGLQTFAPVLSSQQLAAVVAPQVHADDLIVIHQEYEFASTLGFYLRRPTYARENGRQVAVNPIHILEGRSSNLWYGSFFPDAPPIFETQQSLAAKWLGPERIFLWQDLANRPSALPVLPGPIYVIAKSGGKEIVSNRPSK